MIQPVFECQLCTAIYDELSAALQCCVAVRVVYVCPGCEKIFHETQQAEAEKCCAKQTVQERWLSRPQKKGE